MKKRKSAYFSLLFVITIFFIAVILFVSQAKSAIETINFQADLLEKKATVILDPGHGGEDGGAVGINGALEKDINLAISLELQKRLTENNYKVVMIRDADYSVGDSSLGTIAERKRSDTKKRLETIIDTGDCIYIGIHQNHFTESKYYGAQVFYSGNNENSAVLAECIRNRIVTDLQPDNTRENKMADKNIYILNGSEVPSVLVECGFISNAAEADKLCDSKYQKDIANSIFMGIVNYTEELVEKDKNMPQEVQFRE